MTTSAAGSLPLSDVLPVSAELSERGSLVLGGCEVAGDLMWLDVA
jgi:hypothetical protein